MKDMCGIAGLISPKTDAAALLRLVTSSWMSLFLIFVPLGLCAKIFHWGPVAIFVLVGPCLPLFDSRMPSPIF